jgi:hypothetical protein
VKFIRIKNYDEKVSKFLFNLRNKNYVRKNSLNKKIISYKNHHNWFKNIIIKSSLNIILFKKTMVGFIRLEKNKNFTDCSWAVLNKFQGNNIATKGLRNVTSQKIKYRAKIKNDNHASIKVAKKSGFNLKLKRNNIQYFYKN